MILVSVGIENLYFTEDPKITFFKTVYKRYSNFAIESIVQNFSSKPSFKNKASCILSHNGDLVNKMYLVLELPMIPALRNNHKIAWTKYLGYNLLKNVELEIGGKVIDRHDSDWMFINDALQRSNPNNHGLDKMIGNVDELTTFTESKDGYTVYIPINFWFNRYAANALPLVAMYNVDVKINIELNDIMDCVNIGPTHTIYVSDAYPLYETGELIRINNSNNYIKYMNFDHLTMKMGYIKMSSYELKPNDILYGTVTNYMTSVYDPDTNIYKTIVENREKQQMVKSNANYKNVANLDVLNGYLLVDYVFLDTVERTLFKKSDHEYLIDVCSFDNEKIVFNSYNKIKIGYSHPMKSIFVIARYIDTSRSFYNDPFNYMTNKTNKTNKTSIIKKMAIKLNGTDRETVTDPQLFNLIQSYEYLKMYDSMNGIFMYSFSINQYDHQPSGSCNFSKIDDISIDVALEHVTNDKPAAISIYGLNYNVLRIMGGYVGIAFDI